MIASIRQTVANEEIQAGDVLVGGDQCFPTYRRVRALSVSERHVYLTFEDGTSARRLRGGLAFVERPAEAIAA